MRAFAMGLWLVLQSGFTQAPALVNSYGPVVWPKERQHELAGHYAGTLHDYECKDMIARLTLDKAHHYSLKVQCMDPHSVARTFHSGWWIDEIGGSCLILNQQDRDEKMFGFRISDDAMRLLPDGSSCDAANERNAPHSLKRTDGKK